MTVSEQLTEYLLLCCPSDLWASPHPPPTMTMAQGCQLWKRMTVSEILTVCGKALWEVEESSLWLRKQRTQIKKP